MAKHKITRMRGKAQPDGRLAFELIETPVLLISSCGPKYTCTTWTVLPAMSKLCPSHDLWPFDL